MKYKILAISHKGKIRENNEDNAYINGYYRRNDEDNFWTYQDEKNDNLLAAVFDGMGGVENGEIASRMAAEELTQRENGEKVYTQEFSKKANDYVINTNRKIALCDENSNMGTTCVILSVEDDKYYFFNLGDSRGYLFQNGELRQMTKDHNMVLELLKQGVLTKEQAENHRDRHVLYQSLGMKECGEIIEPEIFSSDSMNAEKGDICLLCSDGLTDMLCDEEIQNILNTDKLIEDKIIDLFHEALDKGGKDNVTIVLVEVE